MNTESCDMRRIYGVFLAWWDGDPERGEFMIHESVVSKANPDVKPQDGEPTITIRYLSMVLPDGVLCSIPLRPVPQADMPVNGGHSWEWDGDDEKPTLTPSVNAHNWHGWIRAGRMVSC